MGKVEYAIKTLLYLVPVLLVSSGTEDGRIYEPIRDRHRPRMVRRLENQWK